MESTRHDVFAARDFQRLREVGIGTAREGLRWHLIEKVPGCYDFSSAAPILEAAQKEGIQIVWDLVHFGWPSHLDIFDAGWVESMTGLAAAFGAWLRHQIDEPAIIAPVNEISFVAWGGGDVAYLNPFAVGRGPELKRQLVRGAIRASEVLRAEMPNVRLVSPEPVIHIAGHPERPEEIRQAQQVTSSMFEAWDMIAGRSEPELGGKESYLDVIGINYYDRNQRWNYGNTIWRNEAAYRPFREILIEVYERYHRPLFVSETGTENEDRPHWLAYIADEVRAAMHSGVPLHGICLYPILNHPGWDDDRHCFNGLWDYPTPEGEREIYRPLADELERHERLFEAERQDLERKTYDSSLNLSRSTRFDLPVPPAMELCLSTASALDESFRPDPARFFR